MTNYLNIKDYDDYKFFFVETTANCNLRCKYCYYKKTDKKPEYNADKLVSSLEKFDKIVICFLGGEPFLNPEFIEEIMNHPKLSNRKVIFASNTNGTLLNKIKPEILSKFSFHHLSIDGEKDNHDFFRGQGVFNKIIYNLKYLRKYSDAGIIARMTVSNPDQINDIPKFPKYFDAVYWQLNNSREELDENFLDVYLENLNNLFDYWKEEIFTNKDFTIIPFVGMCDLILTGGMENPDLICGSGTDHVNVCIDGSVYPCPESPHRLSDKEKLGVIENFEFKTYTLKKRCKDCEILKYCGGRCAMTDDDLYCQGIFIIYNLLTSFIDSLDNEKLDKLKENINYQKGLAYTTEIIP